MQRVYLCLSVQRSEKARAIIYFDEEHKSESNMIAQWRIPAKHTYNCNCPRKVFRCHKFGSLCTLLLPGTCLLPQWIVHLEEKERVWLVSCLATWRYVFKGHSSCPPSSYTLSSLVLQLRNSLSLIFVCRWSECISTFLVQECFILRSLGGEKIAEAGFYEVLVNSFIGRCSSFFNLELKSRTAKSFYILSCPKNLPTCLHVLVRGIF